MDEDEKTRVTDLVSTGAGTAVSVAAAVYPAFAWAAPIIQGAFTLAGNRINASRKARLEKALAEKITDLPQDYVEKRVQEEGFQDLLEEAAFQVLRPVSQERIEQIASVLKQGLSEQDAEALRYQTLLGILAQLNDAEIIDLQRFVRRDPDAERAFQEKHKALLAPVHCRMGGPQSAWDKQAVNNRHRNHLYALGLIESRYRVRPKGTLPDFDPETGAFKPDATMLSRLGRLLLRAIDTEVQKAEEGEPSGDA